MAYGHMAPNFFGKRDHRLDNPLRTAGLRSEDSDRFRLERLLGYDDSLHKQAGHIIDPQLL